ncbi:MAG: hypothetical protein CMQ15_07305 [Gammaproteobacteria bacterium]|nr:hypothetical protein [Gammaproteobacteria bacterium]
MANAPLILVDAHWQTKLDAAQQLGGLTRNGHTFYCYLNSTSYRLCAEDPHISRTRTTVLPEH